MTPKNTSRLDEALLKQTLDGFTALMQAALMSDHRGRFDLIGRLAMQAGVLQGLTGSRVEDFDDDADGDMGGIGMMVGAGAAQAALLGRPRRAVQGGDQMEMIRMIVDAATTHLQRSNAPRTLAPIDELDRLIDVRAKLRGEKDDTGRRVNTTDLDDRIAALRKELTNAVVPADVLRGHQAEALGGQEDASLVGEAHGYREDGTGDAPGGK